MRSIAANFLQWIRWNSRSASESANDRIIRSSYYAIRTTTNIIKAQHSSLRAPLVTVLQLIGAGRVFGVLAGHNGPDEHRAIIVDDLEPLKIFAVFFEQSKAAFVR